MLRTHCSCDSACYRRGKTKGVPRGVPPGSPGCTPGVPWGVPRGVHRRYPRATRGGTLGVLTGGTQVVPHRGSPGGTLGGGTYGFTCVCSCLSWLASLWTIRQKNGRRGKSTFFHQFAFFITKYVLPKHDSSVCAGLRTLGYLRPNGCDPWPLRRNLRRVSFREYHFFWAAFGRRVAALN